jgi:hypothetical protein
MFVDAEGSLTVGCLLDCRREREVNMPADVSQNPYSKAPAKKKLLTLIGIYVAALITRFISTVSPLRGSQ